MASCMSSSELAIFRLEFYKKQKKWRLSASARREKDLKKQATQLNTRLNKTYNIDTQVEDDKTELNPLNVAFFEPEFESVRAEPSQPNVSQLSSSLSQQWLEPVNIWPKHVKKSEPIVNSIKSDEINVDCQNKPQKAWIQKRMEVLLKAAEERELEVQSQSGLEKLKKKYVPSNEESIAQYNDCDEDWVPEGIQRTVWSEPCLNLADWPQDIWTDRDLPDGFNYTPKVEENVPATNPSLMESIEAEMTVDSASEFIRGAHEAPHSSEIDLALPSVLRAGEVSSELLSHLTTHQLQQATSEHWRMLTRLLRERQVRQNLRGSISQYTDFNSFEEYPTRDLGPSTSFKDDFVAGSHKLSASLGRGRGRIPQSRSIALGDYM